MKKNYLGVKRLSLVFLLLLAIVFSSCEVDDFTEAVPEGDANAAPSLTLVSPVDTARISLQQNESIVVRAEVADNTPGLSLFAATVIDSAGAVIFEDEQRIAGQMTIASISFPDSLLIVGAEYELEVYVEDTQGRRTESTSTFIGIGLLSNQDEMYVVGNFTGWGADRDVPMTLVADNTWEAATFLDIDDPTFVFLNKPQFNTGETKWGEDAEGICDGTANENGANIICPIEANNVKFIFNDETLEYSIEEFDSNFDPLYVIGNFTGWGNDNADMSIRMTLVEDNMWEAELDATQSVDGAFDASADNAIFKIFGTPSFGQPDFGDGNGDGILDTDPDNNIDPGLSADVYILKLNDESLEYTVERVDN